MRKVTDRPHGVVVSDRQLLGRLPSAVRACDQMAAGPLPGDEPGREAGRLVGRKQRSHSRSGWPGLTTVIRHGPARRGRRPGTRAARRCQVSRRCVPPPDRSVTRAGRERKRLRRVQGWLPIGLMRRAQVLLFFDLARPLGRMTAMRIKRTYLTAILATAAAVAAIFPYSSRVHRMSNSALLPSMTYPSMTSTCRACPATSTTTSRTSTRQTSSTSRISTCPTSTCPTSM